MCGSRAASPAQLSDVSPLSTGYYLRKSGQKSSKAAEICKQINEEKIEQIVKEMEGKLGEIDTA